MAMTWEEFQAQFKQHNPTVNINNLAVDGVRVNSTNFQTFIPALSSSGAAPAATPAAAPQGYAGPGIGQNISSNLGLAMQGYTGLKTVQAGRGANGAPAVDPIDKLLAQQQAAQANRIAANQTLLSYKQQQLEAQKLAQSAATDAARQARDNIKMARESYVDALEKTNSADRRVSAAETNLAQLRERQANAPTDLQARIDALEKQRQALLGTDVNGTKSPWAGGKNESAANGKLDALTNDIATLKEQRPPTAAQLNAAENDLQSARRYQTAQNENLAESQQYYSDTKRNPNGSLTPTPNQPSTPGARPDMRPQAPPQIDRPTDAQIVDDAYGHQLTAEDLARYKGIYEVTPTGQQKSMPSPDDIDVIPDFKLNSGTVKVKPLPSYDGIPKDRSQIAPAESSVPGQKLYSDADGSEITPIKFSPGVKGAEVSNDIGAQLQREIDIAKKAELTANNARVAAEAQLDWDRTRPIWSTPNDQGTKHLLIDDPKTAKRLLEIERKSPNPDLDRIEELKHISKKFNAAAAVELGGMGGGAFLNVNNQGQAWINPNVKNIGLSILGAGIYAGMARALHTNLINNPNLLGPLHDFALNWLTSWKGITISLALQTLLSWWMSRKTENTATPGESAFGDFSKRIWVGAAVAGGWLAVTSMTAMSAKHMMDSSVTAVYPIQMAAPSMTRVLNDSGLAKETVDGSYNLVGTNYNKYSDTFYLHDSKGDKITVIQDAGNGQDIAINYTVKSGMTVGPLPPKTAYLDAVLPGTNIINPEYLEGITTSEAYCKGSVGLRNYTACMNGVAANKKVLN